MRNIKFKRSIRIKAISYRQLFQTEKIMVPFSLIIKNRFISGKPLIFKAGSFCLINKQSIATIRLKVL